MTQSCASSTYWLGGSDNLLQTGSWTWSDGQRFSYTNWESGQPMKGATYCLSVDATTGRWYSDSCGDAKPSLCRVPPLTSTVTTTTPVPSTTNCPTGWTYIAVTKKCYQVPN
ncbi:CLEC-50 protein [Aphelenchoides avenae]|nr:CLEC-50 protein [Aphelenchus avenae]